MEEKHGRKIQPIPGDHLKEGLHPAEPEFVTLASFRRMNAIWGNKLNFGYGFL